MLPLARFQQRLVLRFERVARFDRAVADVDVVVMGRFGEADFAGEVFERDHLVGQHHALQLQDVFDQFVDQRPRALVADHVDAVDFGDVDRVAGRVLGDVAAFGEDAVAALERADPQREAFRAEVLEHREDAAVDLPLFDVFPAALVDVEALVGEHALLQRFLGEQQDAGAAQLLVERVLPLGAVDRGRFEQLPAVEDRLRVDPRRALARRADREVDVRVGAVFALRDVGEDGARDHLRADPDRALPVAFSRIVSTFASAFVPSGLARALRQGAEPRPQFLAVGRQLLFLAAGGDDRAAAADQLAEPGVGVAVAVAVFEDDEVAELGGVAQLADHAVVDGDDRRALLGEDVDPAPGRRGGDDFGGVAGDPRVGGRVLQRRRAASSSE